MNQIIKQDAEMIAWHFGRQLGALRNAKILITGACGMLASYMAYILLELAGELGMELYLQCRDVGKGKRVYRDYLDGSHPAILVDIPIEQRIECGIKFDYVIHAASPASTNHFRDNPVGVIEPNAIGTWNLLNYARECQCQCFLFLSSNAIYGEGGQDKSVLSENDYGIVDPLNERACYMESKRMGEQMCRAFSRQYRLGARIARISHTYGPTFDIESDSRVIPRCMKRMLEGEDIRIYRDPFSKVQYTYAGDIVSGLVCILADGENGEAYNVCGKEMLTMDEAVHAMIRSDERIRSRVIEMEMDEGYAFGAGKGINMLRLSQQKLKGIGWRQLFAPEEGFRRLVESYLSEKK